MLGGSEQMAIIIITVVEGASISVHGDEEARGSDHAVRRKGVWLDCGLACFEGRLLDVDIRLEMDVEVLWER